VTRSPRSQGSQRETVRTPTGELVSLPLIRRRVWILAVVVAVMLMVALAAILVALQPPAGRTPPPGQTQPGLEQP